MITFADAGYRKALEIFKKYGITEYKFDGTKFTFNGGFALNYRDVFMCEKDGKLVVWYPVTLNTIEIEGE